MRIGIDARMYGPKQTGIGNYTKFLLENLVLLSETKPLTIKFFVFLCKEGFFEARLPNNFIKVLAPYKWYSLEEQVMFLRVLRKYKLDLMHFTHFNVPVLYNRPFIVTIHDLTPKFYPGPLVGKYWYRRKAYNFVLKNAIKKSKVIIAPSKFTKNDILKHYKVNTDKIKVIYEGVNHIANNKEQIVTKNKEKQDNNILYLGVIRQHKNLVRLVQAFNILINKLQTKKLTFNKSIKLILAGPDNGIYPELYEVINRLNLKDKVIVTGKVSEKEKVYLLRNAKLVVLPSLYEGFGIVPLEALILGTPVAVSNIGPMPEVLENSAFFFNPRSESDMAKVMQNVLMSENVCKEKIKNIENLLKKYDWQEMAKKTLALYLGI